MPDLIRHDENKGAGWKWDAAKQKCEQDDSAKKECKARGTDWQWYNGSCQKVDDLLNNDEYRDAQDLWTKKSCEDAGGTWDGENRHCKNVPDTSGVQHLEL